MQVADPAISSAARHDRGLEGTAGGPSRWVIGSSAFLAGVGASWMVATSNHLVYAAPFAVLEAVEVWSSVAIGLLYRSRRPHSPVGNLLIVYGFVNALIGLEGSSQPLLALVGAVAEVPTVILIAFLILVYRRRELSRAGQFVLAAWSGLVIIEYALVFVSVPTLMAPTPLAACAPSCPANPMFIASAASIISPLLPWLDPVYRISIFILLGSVFLIYLPRLRRSLPERNVMLPVLGIFSVWLFSSTLYGLTQLTSRESQLIFWVLYLGRLIFPFSFVAGLLAAQSFSAEALTAVLAHDNSDANSSGAATLAQALRDPGIMLASWSPENERFIDLNGHEVIPPVPGSGRVMTRLYRDDLLIGAIISDVALAQYPELLGAAGRAVTMTIDNRRLEAELERSQASISKSQADMAAAGERQRKQIERDLHDSVQQELLATEARLQIVGGLVRDETVQERLAAISEDIALALQHLRDIGRGIPAGGLLSHGLRAALVEVARRAPVPVLVHIEGPGRYPPDIEEAVFFCCSEALQNAEKHAGGVKDIAIDISGSTHAVSFRVADGGRGFDATQTWDGHGLGNMSERMKAVDGWLTVQSTVGQGTVVSGGVAFDGLERQDVANTGS